MIVPDNEINILSTGKQRLPDCDECCHWFLGCLNKRMTWKDKAIMPNLRFLDPNKEGGYNRTRCDDFEWRPELNRGPLFSFELVCGERER